MVVGLPPPMEFYTTVVAAAVAAARAAVGTASRVCRRSCSSHCYKVHRKPKWGIGCSTNPVP